VEPPALGDFCNFSKISVFLCRLYFGQNRYFTAITHQLKAFKISLNVLNRIMKYKFCSIRINVTKYEVTFATNPPRGYSSGDDRTIQ